MMKHLYATTVVLAGLLTDVLAATTKAAPQPSCSTTLGASIAAPSINPAYQYRLVAKGLSSPRAIQFDSAGNLLVLQQRKGIVVLTGLNKTGNCLLAASPKLVVDDVDLNHGLTLSHDSKTLYASSSDKIYSWPYDAKKANVTGKATTLVQGMNNADHDTRTLLNPTHVKGLLVVNRGSSSNIDSDSAKLSSGHGQIRAFNVTNATGTYSWSDGLLLGWGIRNAVGIGEEPKYGGIYSVENSVDQLTRNGVDVHENNPGEKLNYHGFLNGTKPLYGRNYGYPNCVAAWNPAQLPNNKSLAVGSLFSFDNSGATDAECKANRTAPRLVFQAHSAPLDIKFNAAGTAAWVTFHGSWDRSEPTGHKLVVIKFSNGSPVSSLSHSQTSYSDILTTPDLSKCSGSNCLRPVGLAWDGQGRLFMSSDGTGEIYVITRTDGKPTNADLPSQVSANAASNGLVTMAVSTSTSTGGVAAALATRMPEMVGLGAGVAMLHAMFA